MVGCRGRLLTAAIAAQIGQDDPMPGLHQGRRNLVPGHVGLGMPMEQQQRLSLALAQRPDRCTACLDILRLEPGEQKLARAGRLCWGQLRQLRAHGRGRPWAWKLASQILR